MSDLAPEFPLAAALAREAGAGEVTRRLAREALERLGWLSVQRV